MQANSAASGAEALKLLRAAATEGKPYDLALLDVQMPEMDGLTLARAIKADPAIAGTRLIALTSLGHAISARELKKFGIDAYLVKPTKQSRLFYCLLNAMVKTKYENDFAKPAATDLACRCLGAQSAARERAHPPGRGQRHQSKSAFGASYGNWATGSMQWPMGWKCWRR